MMRSHRYENVSLKRLAVISITSLHAGSCSEIIFADSSTRTIAEASNGSRNPAESPTATQLFCQNSLDAQIL